MKVQICKIGNSQGIRLPKKVLLALGFEKEAEMEVKNNQIILKKSQKNPREGWAESIKKELKPEKDLWHGDDSLNSEWDDSEWTWEGLD